MKAADRETQLQRELEGVLESVAQCDREIGELSHVRAHLLGAAKSNSERLLAGHFENDPPLEGELELLVDGCLVATADPELVDARTSLAAQALRALTKVTGHANSQAILDAIGIAENFGQCVIGPLEIRSYHFLMSEFTVDRSSSEVLP